MPRLRTSHAASSVSPSAPRRNWTRHCRLLQPAALRVMTPWKSPSQVTSPTFRPPMAWAVTRCRAAVPSCRRGSGRSKVARARTEASVPSPRRSSARWQLGLSPWWRPWPGRRRTWTGQRAVTTSRISKTSQRRSGSTPILPAWAKVQRHRIRYLALSGSQYATQKAMLCFVRGSTSSLQKERAKTVGWNPSTTRLAARPPLLTWISCAPAHWAMAPPLSRNFQAAPRGATSL